MDESPGIRIRSETETDWKTVYAINAAAFPTPAEAKLVDRLRANAQPIISLVAENQASGSEMNEAIGQTVEQADVLAGHIFFSPVSLSSNLALKISGLAPMAVDPQRQRTGIGSALVKAGLQRCREAGFGAVAVLGHAEFYPKFGFVPSNLFGIKSEYDVPADVFMVIELVDDYLREQTGTIRYHPEFGKL